MDFKAVATQLNAVVARKRPEILTASWIFKNAPECYRFIQKNIRTEWNAIDWDRVTSVLDWKYQRRWIPQRRPKILRPYGNRDEVDAVLDRYRDKLYVFIVPADRVDRQLRDVISIRLVRLAQRGNFTAKQEIMELVRYAVDGWLDRPGYMSRWRGYDEKIQDTIEGCIRRYRYTGSFFKYVYRTLQYAGRGIQSFYAYSLDEPVATDTDKRKMENVVQDPETGEIGLYAESRGLKMRTKDNFLHWKSIY
jgi:hypothetical protein